MNASQHHEGGLVWVDEEYDRDYASDGHSRLGAYLRRDTWLADPDDDLDPVGFAFAVWRTATGPIMAPPYVHVRRDLADVVAYRSDDDPELLVVALDAPTGWPCHLAGHPAATGWQGWHRPRTLDEGPDPYRQPADQHRALLVTARLRLAIPGADLPTPACPGGGAVDVRAAKNACGLIVARVNAAAGPLLAALREAAR
jgi:hypothetical protein